MVNCVDYYEDKDRAISMLILDNLKDYERQITLALKIMGDLLKFYR
jgi:hypothetical protein